MKRRAALFALLAAPALLGAEPRIEFSGVLTADGRTRIALTDLTNNATTWVEPGEVFNGYTVARYDAKHDAVFLKKDGDEIRLGLVPAKTPDAGPPTSSTGGPALSGNPSGSRPPPPPTPAPPLPTPPAPAANNSPAPATAPNPSADATTTPVPSPLPATTPLPAATPSSATGAGAAETTSPSSAGATSPAEPNVSSQGAATTNTPTYTIRGGDTLEAIAQLHGVTVQRIRELNPSLNTSSLRAGDTLRIR